MYREEDMQRSSASTTPTGECENRDWGQTSPGTATTSICLHVNWVKGRARLGQLSVPTGVCLSQSKCRLLGLCHRFSGQMLGLEANPVKPDCRATWRVQDLGLRVDLVREMVGTSLKGCSVPQWA